MAKISLIVPVYGVEKFIERCVRSLFEQTLDDIEYIFVDDCTPDNSIEIIKSVLSDYPCRKKQVKILHHNNNLGLPFARQSGIKVATGEYIAHCDSDDWVDLDLYESLYFKAKSENLDVVVCDFNNTDSHNEIICRGGKATNIKNCINLMLHRKMWWSLCNKIFKRELYDNNIIFPKDGMGEDMCLCLQLMKRCSSIGYIHKYYYYYVNPNSISKTQTKEKILDKFNQYQRNVDILKDVYKDDLSSIFKMGFCYLDFFKYDIIVPLTNDEEYMRLWRQAIKKYSLTILMDNDVLLKEKLKVVLSYFHLYPNLRRL